METQNNLGGIEYQIFEEIWKLVNINEKWQDSSRTNWTEYINEAMINLGRALNFEVYSSNIGNKRYGEWLFDIIWSRDGFNENNERDWRKFSGLAMICEVEWGGYDNILEDFTKLTVGVADYRIMIVNHNEDDKSQNQWETIKNMCVEASQYRTQNFRYLLISLPWVNRENLKVHSWVY